MNIRRFEDNRDYSTIDDQWFYSNFNVIERLFELYRAMNTISESLTELRSYYEDCRKDGVDAIDRSLDITRHIDHLTEAAETFDYCFPELREHDWFRVFLQDLHHAHWRFEDGRFRNADTDEDELNALLGEVGRIIENSPDSGNKGVEALLRRFIENYGINLSPRSEMERFREDLYEARDLYCLGYYSTALLVLGRAVERGLLELGVARNIETIETYRGETDWGEARFFFRNNALHEINMPERHGKVLTDEQYHRISILIDYRNNVAHEDYESVEYEEAERKILDAYALLEEISEKIEHLSELDSEKIPAVKGQKSY